MLIYLAVDHLLDQTKTSSHPYPHCSFLSCRERREVAVCIGAERRSLSLLWDPLSLRWVPESAQGVLWSNVDYFGLERVRVEVSRGRGAASHCRTLRLTDLYSAQHSQQHSQQHTQQGHREVQAREQGQRTQQSMNNNIASNNNNNNNNSHAGDKNNNKIGNNNDNNNNNNNNNIQNFFFERTLEWKRKPVDSLLCSTHTHCEATTDKAQKANLLSRYYYNYVSTNCSSSSSLPSSSVELSLTLKFRFITQENCLAIASSSSPRFSMRTENVYSGILSAAAVNNQQVHFGEFCIYDRDAEGAILYNTRVSDLHLAILHGDVRLVRTLMRDLALKGVLKDALQYAAYLPMNVVDSLPVRKTRSGSETARPSHHVTALHLSLLRGDCGVLREVLSRAGQWAFTEPDPRFPCPLHYAVCGGSLPCLKLLMRFIKKISALDESFCRKFALPLLLNHRDCEDHTPLSLACSLVAENEEIVRLLLLEGADPGVVVAHEQDTALTCACRCGKMPVIKLLLSVTQREQREIQGERLSTVLSPVPLVLRFTNAVGRRLDCYRRRALSSYKCNPSFVDCVSGAQALHIAATEGHLDVVDALLKIGVPWHTQTNRRETLAHIAARYNRVSLLAKLVRLEEKRWSVQNALSAERLLQDMRTMERVLTQPDLFGHTPLYIARQQGHDECIAMLEQGIASIYGMKVGRKQKEDVGDRTELAGANENNEEHESENAVAFIDNDAYEFALTTQYRRAAHI